MNMSKESLQLKETYYFPLTLSKFLPIYIISLPDVSLKDKENII
jgi:hypothetical protein